MKLVNATPHPIVVILDGNKVIIPLSGVMIRVAAELVPVEEINYEGRKIPVVKEIPKNVVFFKEGEPMDEEEIKDYFRDTEGVIVPAMLSPYLKEIQQKIGKSIKFYAPTTSRAIRDENGRIIGVPSLSILS